MEVKKANITNKSGYVFTHMPNHPRSNNSGYIAEHIIVAESKLKRYLVKGEVVHHIDRNRKNNDPENLQVMTISEHISLHNREDKEKRVKKAMKTKKKNKIKESKNPTGLPPGYHYIRGYRNIEKNKAN
jgi:hypothetical protein